MTTPGTQLRPSSLVCTPTKLLAARRYQPNGNGASKRPQATITPLGERLRLEVVAGRVRVYGMATGPVGRDALWSGRGLSAVLALVLYSVHGLQPSREQSTGDPTNVVPLP